MKEVLFSTPLFGLSISFAAFFLGVLIQKKSKKSYLNPLLISYALIISFILLFDIPLDWYMKGGDIINLFLTPATCALALNIYRQWKMIKENWIALTVGTITGSIVSMTFAFFIGRLLGFDETVCLSIVPKGITTPMAMAVSETIGGIPSITVLAVLITGITGNVLSPVLINLFKIKDPTVQGISIGTCSHAIGTSKALELGEKQGALSSVALTLSGIVTVVLSLILF